MAIDLGLLWFFSNESSWGKKMDKNTTQARGGRDGLSKSKVLPLGTEHVNVPLCFGVNMCILPRLVQLSRLRRGASQPSMACEDPTATRDCQHDDCTLYIHTARVATEGLCVPTRHSRPAWTSGCDEVHSNRQVEVS